MQFMLSVEKVVGKLWRGVWESCEKFSTVFDITIKLCYSMRKSVRVLQNVEKFSWEICTENLFGFSLLWRCFA